MPQEVDRTQARQGETPGVTRYVLVASTALAIVALGGLYAWFL
jgi:hypothetical protein